MRRAPVLALALAAVAGCVKSEVTAPNIPDNAIVYRIAPEGIAYHFLDTRNASELELWWLSDRGYTGLNCLGLVPRSAIDTIGSFVFAAVGPNTGQLQRRQGATTDTVTGYFLPPSQFAQGTHGNYALDSTGHLKLVWADGVQSQYFDPSADVTLHDDMITSSVSLHLLADSVQYTWQVSWTRTSGCQ